MPASAVTPPPIRATARGPGMLAVFAAGAGVVLAVVVARGVVDGRLFFPGCGFKWITGHACPGCGGTRSLSALGQWDAAGAFAHNPLIAAFALLVLVAVPLAFLDQRLARGRMRKAIVIAWREHRSLRWGLACLVVLNWVYLLCALE